MSNTDTENGIKEGLNLPFMEQQDCSDAESAVSNFASNKKKGQSDKEEKKALYYANSYESQIFKKNQLKVRKVNVSVTNQLPTKSKKEKKKKKQKLQKP